MWYILNDLSTRGIHVHFKFYPSHSCAAGHVSERTVISEQCVVGAGCRVETNETLPPNTVVYGSKGTRYVKSVTAHSSNQQQLEYLIKVLPNYHHLIKSTAS